MGVEDGDLVDFAIEKFLRAELRDRFGFDKAGRVFQFEIGQQLALCPRYELPGLFSGNNKRRFRFIEICGFAKKTCVERASQPFVSADDQDELLLYLANVK